MNRKFSLSVLSLLFFGALASLQLGQTLSLSHQWHLTWSPLTAEDFADFNFVYAQLPRLVMTLMVGAILGLVGSVMQQLTQNTLTSPLTLGTSSGAWLALIVMNVFWPGFVADYGAFGAMAGALIAFALIIMIAGFNNLTGLGIVIAGMVVNMLLGAIATAIVLLNQQYAQSVFMWGAGDLAQNGWDWVSWLLPKLIPAVVLLVFAPRILTLLRLGKEGAAARGLMVVPAFFILMLVGIWLVSASITAVGLIGFIGLLTPNIARLLGARTPRAELLSSLVLGALLLLCTDMLSIKLTQFFGQIVPSGITAAAIGAPALIWFSRRQLQAQDSLPIQVFSLRLSLNRFAVILIGIMCVLAVFLYTSYQTTNAEHMFTLPDAYQWSLRWPRGLTALGAGIGLAVAGVILQRLIYNPLASPDILGVSSGATFCLVFATLFFGQSVLVSHWLTAFIGSVLVLVILLILGRKHSFSPSSVILTGIAITALLQAFVQLCLVRGDQQSYQIMQWLAGSTYRVTPEESVVFFCAIMVLFLLAIGSSRWLTLLSIGRSFSASRGINVQYVTVFLLVLVALLCAAVTAVIGPISFVGLIAPHLAAMLGANRVRTQLWVSGLIGGTVMLWSDWLGQVILFPNQVAAGTLVAMIGSCYFLGLLLVSRVNSGLLK